MSNPDSVEIMDEEDLNIEDQLQIYKMDVDSQARHRNIWK